MTNTLTLNEPYLDSEGRANLRTFTNDKDRDPPPIFVGRENVIEKIRQDVQERRSDDGGKSSYTRVIFGAPGSGKTSLLDELKKRLDGKTLNEKRIDHSVVAVELDGSDLSNEETAAQKMIAAYEGRTWDPRKEKTFTIKIAAKPANVGGELEYTSKKKGLKEQNQDFGSVWGAVLQNTKIDTQKSVFLLLIDESQSIDGSLGDSAGRNEIAMNLNVGTASTGGLKIVPVFAGLSNTPAVLANRGVSRYRGEAIPMGSLTSDETKDLVTNWMQHETFGFKGLFLEKDIGEVAQKVSVASECWPVHTYTYLSELGKAILSCDSNDDLVIDLDEVLDRGHDRRVAYYVSRLRVADIEDYADVVRDVAFDSTDGNVTRKDLFDRAKNDYQLSDEDTREWHRRAIRAGILEYASNENESDLKFPIPSLYTYLHCGRNQDKFKSAMRSLLKRRRRPSGGSPDAWGL